jgi:Ni/Fe-hydrogenase 1 B-type cytochrome subunit
MLLKRVKVWDGAVRGTHWVMALSVIVLAVTGSLLGSGLVGDDVLFDVLRDDLHLPCAHLLAVALVVRVFLLFTSTGPAGWRDCVPRGAQWQAVTGMLRFYLTWTRSPLPAYYTHNPAWGPLYLALFAVLCAQLASGLIIEFSAVRRVLHVTPGDALAFHQVGHSIISTFLIVHLVAVFLHDWKGTGSEISAMVSGHKVFVVDADEVRGRSTASRIAEVRIDGPD